MLDTGLLLTGVLLWLVVAAAARWAPVSIVDRSEIVDRLIVSCVLGLIAGRLVAVVLDDPASLRSLRSLLVIRGGVEFWPGVAVALGALAWALRRQRLDVSVAMAELAPFLLWGYATYEAACVVRDGCYGPVSAVGLVPDGLRTRMFPVGLVVALAVFAFGFAVRHLWAWSPTAKVLLALGGVAAARSAAAIWLPRLGDGPTRQHLESIAVVLVVIAVATATAIVRARKKAAREPSEATTTPVTHVVPPTATERS
jgi:hypothetical protein